MVYVSISGREFKKLLVKTFWFKEISQKWSHIKLWLDDWMIIIIPDHKELKEWLFNWILQQIWVQYWKSKIEIFNKLFK